MKTILKRLIFIIFSIIILPFILISKMEEYFSDSEEIHEFFAQLFSLVPGKIGDYIRQAYYFYSLKKLSLETCICFGALIPHRDTSIQKGSVIGSFSIIGSVDMGEHVLISSRVSVPSGKHQHMPDEEGTKFSEMELNYKKLKIGSNTWIGEGAIVLEDIGENSIVAAGSVVLKKIPANVTVAGNPARIVSLKK